VPLNFTGRDPGPPLPAPAEDRSFSGFAAVCLVLAGLAAVAAVLIPLNRPKPSEALPPLSGTSLTAPEPARPSAPVAQPAPPPPIVSRAAQPVARPKARADHKALFLAALRRSGPGVMTLAVEDDAGAQAYGRQLSDLFHEAGWTVTWTAVFGSGPAATGLSAALGDTAQDYAVRDAFAAVGVKLGPRPATPGIVHTPELFVGAPA
jgi:hypothetical protein